MPYDEVRQQHYGAKATPAQRAAYEEVVNRMIGHRQDKEEADKVLTEWVKDQRAKMAKRIEAEEKQAIDAYLLEQVTALTAILDKEEMVLRSWRKA